MKVAIPTRNNKIDDHFGHCESYTIYTIGDNKNIENIENFAAPVGCGCKSGIAEILAKKGVDNMLAGNMGEGAFQTLQYFGIKVVRGCHGNPADVLTDWLNKKLNDSGESCHNHNDCHNN
jgi:predicted Fe-Mo cluster-binding NifX family protein